MAELTKPRVEKVLNLPVTLIDNYEDFSDATDAFEIKLQLLSKFKCSILYIDTDIVLFKWNWAYFDWRVPHFVLNNMSEAWPGTKAIRSLLYGHPCVNAGLWYAPATAAPLYEEALRIKRTSLKDFPYCLGDQTPLNVALMRTPRNSWKLLPEEFNRQLPPATVDRPPRQKDLAIHLVGGTISTPSEPSDLQSKLRRVRAYCEKYPL